MENPNNSRWLMAKWAGIAVAIVGLIYFATWPADAQTPPSEECGPSLELRKALKERYNEDEVSIGIINDTAFISVLVSPGGETWTVIATGANGVSCVIGVGKDWLQGDVPVAGDPV